MWRFIQLLKIYFRNNPRRYSRQIMALQEAEISRMASLAVIEDEDRAEQANNSKVEIWNKLVFNYN